MGGGAGGGSPGPHLPPKLRAIGHMSKAMTGGMAGGHRGLLCAYIRGRQGPATRGARGAPEAAARTRDTVGGQEALEVYGGGCFSGPWSDTAVGVGGGGDTGLPSPPQPFLCPCRVTGPGPPSLGRKEVGKVWSHDRSGPPMGKQRRRGVAGLQVLPTEPLPRDPVRRKQLSTACRGNERANI